MLKIYLDNCCYNRPSDEQNQDLIRLETEAKLIIQNKIKKGVYLLVWSSILVSENDENFSEDKRTAIRLWKNSITKTSKLKKLKSLILCN